MLATVKRDGLDARGEKWSETEEQTFRDSIRGQYETQGHPYYASARLWDDGVIDPVDTRRTLGMALAVSMNRPWARGMNHGVFRM